MATKKTKSGRPAKKAKPAKTVPVRTVIGQDWWERERGWGMRPDGFTLHLTTAARDAYIKYYNETYNNLPSAPDEYTKAEGDPKIVQVSEKIYKKLLKYKDKNGLWGRGASLCPDSLLDDKYDVGTPA
jgi:hypothetical protein